MRYIHSQISLYLISFLLIVSSIACAGLLNHLEQQKILNALHQNYGERAYLRGQAWFNVMETALPLSSLDKLEKINNFFNLLHFVDDIKLWGLKNYWATPVEFLGVNGGDCEDFAIAKYFTLLELGIPDEKMRITMVKAVKLNQYHMVVAYYETPNAIPLILDNLIGQIKPANQRQDLIPVYSFNGKQLWMNKEKGQGVLAGKSERLKRWSNLNQRMRISTMRKPKLNLE
ncbi:transglutaminase-like cysteine peptidase [Psychromonas sp. MME2]|uniref:transglutaminase-like cysteine peptidase n=1 Tax=unclassified Psychromonas TaxID=2614957 RepID=UPI00339C0652